MQQSIMQELQNIKSEIQELKQMIKSMGGGSGGMGRGEFYDDMGIAEKMMDLPQIEANKGLFEQAQLQQRKFDAMQSSAKKQGGTFNGIDFSQPKVHRGGW